MKYKTAVAKIEWALELGLTVKISYHRKYNTKINYFDTVQGIATYEYKGKICKDILTYWDSVSGYSHIVDELIIA